MKRSSIPKKIETVPGQQTSYGAMLGNRSLLLGAVAGAALILLLAFIYVSSQQPRIPQIPYPSYPGAGNQTIEGANKSGTTANGTASPAGSSELPSGTGTAANATSQAQSGTGATSQPGTADYGQGGTTAQATGAQGGTVGQDENASASGNETSGGEENSESPYASFFAINTNSFGSASVGVPYNLALSASGGKGGYTWAVSGMPPGLSATQSGIISGTPSSAGSYSAQISVSDGVSTATAYMTFNVS